MFLTPDDPLFDNPTFSEQDRKELLGGKGAGLLWMSKKGFRVPPFVVIPTTVWAEYKKNPAGTMAKIKESLPAIKAYLSKPFGYMPLVSVRSGARVSCPGMMDTILNVGLSPDNEQEWTKRLGEECYVDSLQRLLAMYGSVVHGLSRQELEKGDLIDTVNYYTRKAGDFPNLDGQLLGAIEAVFQSWDNERAVYYRKVNNIPDEWGTAVTIQAMVFGNLNENSCTGVMFTRNPDTGEDGVTGDFLVKAQGEDVVAGIVAGQPLADMVEWDEKIADELLEVAYELEKLLGDVQDVEFTVQDKVLYILQTRNAKRTAKAAVVIAADYLEAGKPLKDVFKGLSYKVLQAAQVDSISAAFKTAPHSKGIPACAGVAKGVVVHSSQKALTLAKQGKDVVLVTNETSPDDIEAMHLSRGVLTMNGGATSHAAVVARSFNRCCVVGVGKSVQDYPEGSYITVDGNTGRVWLTDKVPTTGANTALVDRLVQTALKSGVEISNVLPSAPVKSYVLDLSDKLHYSLPDLQALISEGYKRVTDTLYLSFMCLEDPALGKFYQQFMLVNKTVLQTKAAAILAAVPVPKGGVTVKVLGSAMGKSLPPHLSLSAVVPASLEEMLTITTPGQYNILPSHQDSKAMARLQKWMAAEGIFFTPINTYIDGSGGFCTRTVMLKELLG